MQLLVEVIAAFDVHSRLIDELIKIICGSGYEQRFFKQLVARLRFLSEYGVEAVVHEEFELIRDGVFSMHLAQDAYNIRVLYSFFDDGTPCLLSCFYERGGKRKTDYTPHIDPAIARFKERLEAQENEQ